MCELLLHYVGIEWQDLVFVNTLSLCQLAVFCFSAKFKATAQCLLSST